MVKICKARWKHVMRVFFGEQNNFIHFGMSNMLRDDVSFFELPGIAWHLSTGQFKFFCFSFTPKGIFFGALDGSKDDFL